MVMMQTSRTLGQELREMLDSPGIRETCSERALDNKMILRDREIIKIQADSNRQCQEAMKQPQTKGSQTSQHHHRKKSS